MAPRIRRMALHLANQIAAGEVVERPSSVVKELVENAVDAGARRIAVVVGDGGRNIRVTDDGGGMGPEDAALAFERFATSKLEDAEQLFALETLGFRGEALASIAAVARVECLTRLRGAELGTRVACADGHQEVAPAGCPEGTTMAISDLFHNTPARLKFMRSPATELGHVTETVTSLALAHPEVALRLTVNDREVFDSSGSRGLADAVALVLGPEVASRLREVHGAAELGTVTGFVSPPEMLRSDRNKQWLFLNGRPVRHPTLARAVEEGYRGQVPVGRFPWYVLSLEVDPGRVDVNVHPAKKEVRLADGTALFHLVRDAVLRALRRPEDDRPQPARLAPFDPIRPPAPAAEGGSPVPRGAARPTGNQVAAAMDAYRPAGEQAPLAPFTLEPLSGDAFAGAGTPQVLRFPFEQLRVIGQVHATYIVCEHPDGIYFIDQHNSHERHLYEQLTPAQVFSQELLMPAAIALSPVERGVIAEAREALAALGFVVEPFGEEAWVLRAVPAILPSGEAEATLRELLATAAATGVVAGPDREDRWRVSIACHAAVKAGDRLSHDQMQGIVRSLSTAKQPMTCPHGRPTGWLLGKDDLDKKVLRHYPSARRSTCS